MPSSPSLSAFKKKHKTEHKHPTRTPEVFVLLSSRSRGKPDRGQEKHSSAWFGLPLVHSNPRRTLIPPSPRPQTEEGRRQTQRRVRRLGVQASGS